jgi:hypothetical protein
MSATQRPNQYTLELNHLKGEKGDKLMGHTTPVMTNVLSVVSLISYLTGDMPSLHAVQENSR